jgi:hypothetical protein
MGQEMEIDLITRIKFLMEYDIKKSPCENILSEQQRIRGVASPQQSDTRINLGQFISGPQNTPRDPYNAQLKPLDKRYNTIYDVPTTRPVKWGWDHKTAGNIELIMTLAGMGLMASGLGVVPGTVLVGAGTAVGIADALMYYSEGKPYDGTIMMALQIIPGNELIKGLSEYSPVFAKQLPEFQQVLKKVAENKTLSDFEGKLYELGSKTFKMFLPKLGPKLRKYSFLFLISILRRLPLLGVMKFLRRLSKGSKFVGKLLIKVGRIAITFDQLWILLSTPEMSKSRDKSEFKKILQSLIYDRFTEDEIDNMWDAKNMLYNSDGTPNLQGQEECKDFIVTEEFLTKYTSGLDSLVYSDLEKLNSEFQKSDFKNVENVKVKGSETNFTNVSSPITIESILSGKQTVRKGQKGQVVQEIQKMLFLLGYDLGESGKDKVGRDSDFGDITEKAVIQFQKDNNLKDTSGVVGKETLSLLKKLYEKA